MIDNKEQFYFKVCCLACGHEQYVIKTTRWSKCKNQNCRIDIKVRHEATREDLRQVERALRQLMAGQYEVLE